jgi:P27 family predicted phage terminase small subunit
MPAHLKSDPVAVGIWKSRSAELIKLKKLRPEQADAFAMYCKLVSDEQRLTQLVNEEGWTIATEKGPAINPTARMLNQTRNLLLASCKEFGLTIAAEARIPTEKPEEKPEDDALAAFGILG